MAKELEARDASSRSNDTGDASRCRSKHVVHVAEQVHERQRVGFRVGGWQLIRVTRLSVMRSSSPA